MTPTRAGRGRTTRTIASGFAAALVATGCSLAPIDLGEERPLPLRSTITSSDGNVLARLYNENRSPISLRRVPQTLIAAVLATEDKDFFKHEGYDLRAMTRALLVNIREGEIVQGGSTITQQYVKNTYFRRPARTFERKLRELRLAIEVERKYSKREILERYLNSVYLGQGAYGVKAATETYFGHGIQKLTVAEAALIAGLIKAPSRYNPYEHPGRARRRRDYVLQRMLLTGRITPAERRRALRGDLGIRPSPPRPSPREPYFVEAVRQELLADPRFGSNVDARDRFLHEGGLLIKTTLDRELQRAAEEAIASILDEPGDPEASLVSIRPRTGEIVAMIGGRDWSASQVNLALGAKGGGSGRQPGSSFKPIVAATALEAGIRLDTKYESSPAVFDLGEGETWTVSNAEGQDYGQLPLDEAMVRSINGVYARLALDLGAGSIASMASILGVESKLPPYPAIALGASEVSVVDMAAAFSTFANAGTAIEPTTIKEVRSATGEVYGPDQEVVEGAMSPGNAYLVTDVLQEVIARGTGTAADIGRPAAGKTGTTNDFADAWFVGYTPQLVTAVWVGYPQGRVPMRSVHGITVMGGTFPAQIWREFMMYAHRDLPVEEFELPKGELIAVAIDPKSGLLAAPWCKSKVKVMLRQLAPTDYCPPPPPEPSPTPSPTPTKSPDTDAKRPEVVKGERHPAPEEEDKKEKDQSNEKGPDAKERRR